MAMGFTADGAEQQAAQDLADNAIHAARELITGTVLTECLDCGEDITPERVEFLRAKGMKCHYCIHCQSAHDKAPRVRMLDNIL